MSEVELAGERMRISEDDAGTLTITFDDQGTGRRCGGCQLCCRLLPVPPLRKGAGTRCRHQKHAKGCAIYPSRPSACRTWSCRWLADPRTAGMPRPDRCHYVIDLEYDYVRQVAPDGSETKRPVAQVWVDPLWPDAWRAPELRAWMLDLAERWHCATIIRFSSRKAIVVFPPPISADRQWHEVDNGRIEARTPHEHAILTGWEADALPVATLIQEDDTIDERLH